MPDIVIAGATFHDVPQIDIPQDGGGTASFMFESGTKFITENGTHDVSGFASAEVNVSGGGTPVIEALSVTQNGTYTASGGVDGYSPVTVNVSGGGSPSADANDVNFRDYDGTIVYSYSASDFAALTAMPDNPSHSGLIARGWNWALSDAKTYVAKYGRLEIGQMYITDDGKTKIYIHIDHDTPSSRMTFYVRFTATVKNGVTIDWGDGSTETNSATAATNYPHTYAAAGDYVITLEVTNGSVSFEGTSGGSGHSIYGSRASASSYNRGRIRAVEIGENVTSIGSYAFYNCYSLTSITIPDSVTSIGSSMFNNCYSLTSITIPDSVTSIGSSTFNNCYSLTFITIPDGVTSIWNSTFNSCYSLTSITIPDDVTSIGSTAFGSCYSLTSITIPDGVTDIGSQAFQNCYGVAEYHLLPTTPPTLANTNAFSNIASDCVIYVPVGTLEAYQSATNWSTYASKMQEEPQ